jgi:hypothetical protein
MGAFGDAHPRATVTEDQVRQIIQLLQSRKTQKEVARQFGVNRLVVEGIARGRNWQHVPRPANFDTTIRRRAKLTEDQVREIRHLLNAGHSQGGIAKRFDCRPHHYPRHRHWPHVELVGGLKQPYPQTSTEFAEHHRASYDHSMNWRRRFDEGWGISENSNCVRRMRMGTVRDAELVLHLRLPLRRHIPIRHRQQT